MKIVFSTDQIYLHGGIEKVMAQKANYFADVLDYEVIILTTEQKQNSPCYTLSPKIQLIDLNINYEREKSFVHPVNLVKVPRHIFKWIATMRQLKPQFLVVCNYAFDFYWTPFLFSKIAKYKEYHSSRYYISKARSAAKGIVKWGYALQDYCEQSYTALLLLNSSEIDFYSSNSKQVIPNSIESSNYTAPLVASQAIAAGRLAPVKNFDALIEIWAQVVKKEPTWTLSIYGQGEPDYVAYLQAKIHELKVENQVFIRQAVPNLQETMQSYSMYLMTSHTECFPMVLLEALSVGLPCVSYNCPTGPAHIITPEQDGYLVSDQNQEAFVEKVLFLIRHPEIRMQLGENAKQNVQRFSNENVMRLWQMNLEKTTI
jgi:glycosyltransferase involved in cell wall biosynthesis